MTQSSRPVVFLGQISPSDVARLADDGVVAVVCHRPDGEEPGQPSATEIGQACAAAGLDFVHAPVSGLPSPVAVEATRDAMARAGGRPIALYCRSGMRSAATWAMAAVADGGDAEDVRARALEAGYDLSRLPL